MSTHHYSQSQRMETNSGMYLPHIVPPPPYSTLPSRNQRRLHIEAQPTIQATSTAHSAQSASSNTGTTTTNNQSADCLPSYHHLYSSSSPSSLRRRRRRLRQRRRESHLSENKKYLIFISIVLVVGIILTLVGVITLSLFTVSFGFTFILFSLLLYKLLPSSKYGDNFPAGLPHSTPYLISSDASLSGVLHTLGAPPPSYQEATQLHSNSTQLVQLQPASFINRVTAACTGSSSSNSCNSSYTPTVASPVDMSSINANNTVTTTNNGNCTVVTTTRGPDSNRISDHMSTSHSSSSNRLHFVTIIEATI